MTEKVLNLGEALNKKPLYEQIADSIEEAIIYNSEQASKLPSEMALAGQFGVSRTIIREALKLLQARGLVEIRVGGGAYITKPESKDISELLLRIVQMDHIEDKEVYEMRIILEVAAIREATGRITEDEISGLEAQVDMMEESMSDLQKRIDMDCEFHCLIARYSGNRMLSLLVESMTGVLRKFIITGIRSNGGNEDGIYHHREIIKALRTRDAEAAAEALTIHLDRSWANVRRQRSLIAFSD